MDTRTTARPVDTEEAAVDSAAHPAVDRSVVDTEVDLEDRPGEEVDTEAASEAPPVVVRSAVATEDHSLAEAPLAAAPLSVARTRREVDLSEVCFVVALRNPDLF